MNYSDSGNFINRELSWMEFNSRVLAEARDKSIPLFERLKFLSITSSNLDEFVMIRVASLNDMVNAGYNPVALIVVMSKVFPQTRYEWCCTHPLTSRRMMEVYEYIYKKYPEYLVNNPYKENPFYQNFLLTSKENREKFQQKVKSNSTRKVHYL